MSQEDDKITEPIVALIYNVGNEGTTVTWATSLIFIQGEHTINMS